MTRNSKKFQNQEQVPQPIETPPMSAQDMVNKLSFVAPTSLVELPTSGKFYSKTNPLCGVETVEIKHMTAREEDLLSNITSRQDMDIYARLIDSLLVNKDFNSSMFCEEDRTAILVQARISGYGSSYKVVDYCYSCESPGVFSYDLTKAQTIEKEESEGVEYDIDTDTFSVVLPNTSIPLTIKNFTDDDRKVLMTEKAKKEELGIEFNYTISYLNRIIIAIAGSQDREIIKQLCEVMPAVDAKFLNNFYDNIRPRLSMLQDVECPSCGASSRKEVPVSWAFFRPNERVHRKSDV